MTNQIPHLTMDIIASRAADDLGRTEETAEQHYLGAPVPDYRAAVDAVIAARDREVISRELLEAADEIDRLYFGPDQRTPFSTGAKHKWGATQAAARLRARAERIRKAMG